MASVSLKRPHDFDMSTVEPSCSHQAVSLAAAAGAGVQHHANFSQHHNHIHQNHHHHHHHSHHHSQPYQFGSQPQATSFNSSHHLHLPTNSGFKRRCNKFSPNMNIQNVSPFKDSSTLLNPLSDQIASSIKEEVFKASHSAAAAAAASTAAAAAASPASSATTATAPSTSSLNASPATLSPNQQQQHHHHHNQHHPNSALSKYNEPHLMFTLAQTQTICERIIKKREQELREEYDAILHRQLAEQYETFVRYTQDNIKTHINTQQTSYIS